MTTHPDDLHELMYSSRLAFPLPMSDIEQLVRTSRLRNAGVGITSVLLFDGSRFCQYIEGPIVAVLGLADRIEHDLRHVNFVVRHQGSLAQRRLDRWRLACGLRTDARFISSVENEPPGVAAVRRLISLLPALDIDT